MRMREAASESALVADESEPGTAQPSGRVIDEETGRSNWLSLIFWLLEQRWPTLLAIPTVVAALVTHLAGHGLTVHGLGVFAAVWFSVPVVGIGFPAALIVYKSRRAGEATGDWERYVTFRDPADAKRHRGKKIPMEVLYEAY